MIKADVVCCRAEELVESLDDESVELFALDPPFYGIVEDKWDNLWPNEIEYVSWFTTLASRMCRKLTHDGSIVYFGGTGKHCQHPFWKTIIAIEERGHLFFRDTVTWSKRRGYGRPTAYLYAREEFVWFSKSKDAKNVRFNVPLTNELRGYSGFNSKYPALSPYKRVTNVWRDIPELMRPRRTAEKPIALMERIVSTHSHPGDFVVDPFCGLGTTGVACVKLGRMFLGCDVDEEAVKIAKEDLERETLKKERDEEVRRVSENKKEE